MHIHILGICGTFMGGLALLARAAGHQVTGCDANVYPPMSTQLEAAGIHLVEGYEADQLHPAPDLVVVGNAMKRGIPVVEAMLNQGLPYTSGPQWLSEHLLTNKWVLAVSGTHGKTTTASILAWLLEAGGLNPGFLIGGVPGNFAISARACTDTPFFVVEADEYDSAFFDKRSKFVHYRPRTLIINNLEFDHADIFDDLAAIQRQFHHLMRTVPGNGLVLTPSGDANVSEVLSMGCWSEQATIQTSSTGADAEWSAELQAADGTCFDVIHQGQRLGRVSWSQLGLHNVSNALMAIAAARHVGVRPADAIAALADFRGVKRRMEDLGNVGCVHVYDDFAHHPTAIATTLAGLRARVGDEKIIAVIEPRSNTMRMGEHRGQLASATVDADEVLWFQPEGLGWQLDDVVAESHCASALSDIDTIIDTIKERAQAQPLHVVIMSNGGFQGIHQRLLAALRQAQSAA